MERDDLPTIFCPSQRKVIAKKRDVKKYRCEQFSGSLTFRIISAAVIFLHVILVSRHTMNIVDRNRLSFRASLIDENLITRLEENVSRSVIFVDRFQQFDPAPLMQLLFSFFFFGKTDGMFIRYRSHNCDRTFNCV